MLDFNHRLDQAGVLIRRSESTWVKAGVEICDGAAHVGAVVTRGAFDWSMMPVPAWRNSLVTVRAMWTAGALVLCARSSQSAWRTLRVCPWDADTAEAGPFCAAPDRGDLAVRFIGWHRDVADVQPQARSRTVPERESFLTANRSSTELLARARDTRPRLRSRWCVSPRTRARS
jgi:regulation of enolase protein 1 (concanavalin A-like superfamily)